MGITKDEKELSKFVMIPAYRETVIKKVQKEQDNQYHKRIRQLETEKEKLVKARAHEITRIANLRWEKIAGGKLLVNRTEGKVIINQSETLFSNIQGAEINMQTGYRVVTQETAKSKKHASLGGAVVGGALFGPLGAVAGGVGLAKTTTKGKSTSNQIPICNHIGVSVNIAGFLSEIVILSRQVDQSSMSFTSAQNEAQGIISQLGVLARTPVPQSYLSVVEERSVKSIDGQIEQKIQEIQYAINDKPTYNLPETYRTNEQRFMSDEEYLSYLRSTDQVRQQATLANAEEMNRQKAIQKDVARQQKEEQKEMARQQKEEQKEMARQQKAVGNAQNLNSGRNYTSTAKSIGGIFVSVIFWAFSIFFLISFLVAITIKNGLASGIVFLATALFINPLIYELIRNKLFKIPRWVCIIILIIGFIMGGIMFPASNSNGSTTNSTVATTARSE